MICILFSDKILSLKPSRIEPVQKGSYTCSEGFRTCLNKLQDTFRRV